MQWTPVCCVQAVLCSVLCVQGLLFAVCRMFLLMCAFCSINCGQGVPFTMCMHFQCVMCAVSTLFCFLFAGCSMCCVHDVLSAVCNMQCLLCA